MQVNVTLEYRFCQTKDGHVYAQIGFGYDFWKRYLSVFDHVNVMARVEEVDSVPDTWSRSDGPGVTFTKLPYYIGPTQYVKQLPKMLYKLYRSTSKDSAFIFRVPSQIATSVTWVLGDRPFGLEVVGSPKDSLAKESMKHPLRPFFQWYFINRMQRQCQKACAVSYVTREQLQTMYPVPDGTFSTHYSSIVLRPEMFAPGPKVFKEPLKKATLINVGSMQQYYKGQDTIIRAVAHSRDQGVHLEAILVGEGVLKAEFEELARSLNVADRIHFKGRLTFGKEVFDQMDAADFFIMSSTTEGLPRVVVESYARGLPCIGTRVGGVPELVREDELIPHSKPEILAAKIQELMKDPERCTRLAAENYDIAKDYMDHILNERRRQFYQVVRDNTRQWVNS